MRNNKPFTIKLAIVTVLVTMPVFTNASEFCDMTEEFSQMLLEKRIYESQSKSTAKAMVRAFKSSMSGKYNDDSLNSFIEYLNNMVDSAYKVKVGNNSNQNKKIIANFVSDSTNNCVAEMRAKEKRLEELKARKRELEREQARLSGEYYGIDSSRIGFSITHNIKCKTGRLGKVIQNKDGNIHAYFNKKNPSVSVRNHNYSMTLSEAARLACK